MNWLNYLLEANLYLAAFYLVYSLLFAKDTHYQLNRAYLLVSSVLAFVLPLVQLNFLKPTIVYLNVSAETYTPVVASAPLWQVVLFDAYLLGALMLTVRFIFKLIQLRKLALSGRRVDEKGHRVIQLNGSNTAFSFFNYLFIGDVAGDESLIIKHELVHIRQKHSADVLFTELLQIVNWFNPIVYLLQRSIRTQHEYIADEQTAESTDNAVTYASFLVNNAYGLSGPAITHSFFNQNLLKKRIIMLNQKRSGNLARLKYLLAVPLCAALLGESTLGFSKSYGFIGIGTQKTAIDTIKKFKVVPDGHKGSTVKGKKGTMKIARDTVRYVTPPPPPLTPVKKTGKVKVTDVILTPPPPPVRDPKVKVTDVILTPPPAKTTKVKVVDVKLLPPPPPPVPEKKSAKPVKVVDEIRIEEPAKTAKPISEIRIEEQVKASDNAVKPNIRIESPAPAKKQ